MSRGTLVLIVLVLVVLAVLVGLASVNTEVEPQPVEKPVANEVLVR